MQKLLVIFVISVSLTSSFIVNVVDNKTTVFSEVSKPRTVDRTFNMLYNLYKMFNSSHEKKPSKKKQKLVPYDGLYYGTYDDHQPAWEDNNLVEETGVMKQEEKKKEPQFWLFDNFAKKTDLLLMTKILLKIIIFKKIVKFIALVCLLFFVPTLNDSSMNESTNSTSSEEHAKNYDVYGK